MIGLGVACVLVNARRAVMPTRFDSLAPLAGRGWRAAPGEGLPQGRRIPHVAVSRTVTAPHPPCGHLLPARGEKGTDIAHGNANTGRANGTGLRVLSEGQR